MPELFLLRHAKSDWSDPKLGDFDRPLAPRGVRAATLMGKYLHTNGLLPDLVLCSSAKRAKETFKILLTALASTPEISYLKSLYLASPSGMLTVLRRQNADRGRILLIAHNPGMQHLALDLCGSDRSAPALLLAEKYPTAALVRFRVPAWSSLGDAPAELVDYVRPRQLAG